MNTPRVSAIIPAFNSSTYIAAAIDSVLAQTWPDFELLVLDDGSTDDTAEILSAYAGDPRVRIVTHARNRGLPFTRNEGLDLARGEYVALLDSDDLAMPERFERQIRLLDDAPSIAVLGSWVQKIGPKGHPAAGDTGKRPVVSEDLAALMLFRCGFYNPSVMARTDVLRAYRYRETFSVGQDYDLWVRIARDHRLATVPERLTAYRAHTSQITAAKAALVKSKTHLIHAAQLDDLGLRYDQADLDNHYLLKYGGKAFERMAGRMLDRDYLDWANEWLSAILAANRRAGRFPEPALSRIVGRFWVDLCRKTSRREGRSIWWQFARSSLALPALSSFRHPRFDQ